MACSYCALPTTAGALIRTGWAPIVTAFGTCGNARSRSGRALSCDRGRAKEQRWRPEGGWVRKGWRTSGTMASPIRVIVVDDDREIRQILRGILERAEGIEV